MLYSLYVDPHSTHRHSLYHCNRRSNIDYCYDRSNEIEHNLDFFDRPEQETFEVFQDPAFADNESDPAHSDSSYGDAVTAPVLVRQSADEIDPENPETWGRVGRNSACPCGSGKKYKHCHGLR